jgi:hypothetical protein
MKKHLQIKEQLYNLISRENDWKRWTGFIGNKLDEFEKIETLYRERIYE